MIKYQVLTFVMTLFIYSSCNQVVDEVVEHEDRNEKLINDSSNQLKNTFIPPELPSSIVFASEKIPLQSLDIKEGLDRELVVNNFWHSNTFFYFKRANRWFPIMKEILEEEGIPTDFLYLAVIESGLTQATSPSGAKGFWQFMPSTATDYDLEVNQNVDERMHIAKSTRAACKYLKKAYDKLGSWVLAAAGYNRGVNGISRAIESQQVDNFFDLRLNEETSRYVYRIIALKMIMENPEEYGFYFTESNLYPPYKTKSVEVTQTIPDLVAWSLEQDITLKTLTLLNPWIKGTSLVVSRNKSYEILLPENTEQLSPYKGL